MDWAGLLYGHTAGPYEYGNNPTGFSIFGEFSEAWKILASQEGLSCMACYSHVQIFFIFAGILLFQTSGPVHACSGIALPFIFLTWVGIYYDVSEGDMANIWR
jgi:hypothetical protein